MMRCNTFARSAVFAALAAAGWLPWIIIAGPCIGMWSSRALYLVAATVMYVAGLSPRGARVTAAIVAGVAAGGVALAAHTAAELAIGLAVVLGIARSGFLYRAAPARAVTTEVALLGGGLLFARFLAGWSLPSTAVALWGFLLVQSIFFLVAGVRMWPLSERRTDPFDDAYRHALTLLDG